MMKTRFNFFNSCAIWLSFIKKSCPIFHWKFLICYFNSINRCILIFVLLFLKAFVSWLIIIYFSLIRKWLRKYFFYYSYMINHSVHRSKLFLWSNCKNIVTIVKFCSLFVILLILLRQTYWLNSSCYKFYQNYIWLMCLKVNKHLRK